MKPLPSQDELLRQFRYNPETGDLFWRARPIPETGSVDVRIVKNWGDLGSTRIMDRTDRTTLDTPENGGILRGEVVRPVKRSGVLRFGEC